MLLYEFKTLVKQSDKLEELFYAIYVSPAALSFLQLVIHVSFQCSSCCRSAVETESESWPDPWAAARLFPLAHMQAAIIVSWVLAFFFFCRLAGAVC